MPDPRRPDPPASKPTHRARPTRTGFTQIHCTHLWHQGALPPSPLGGWVTFRVTTAMDRHEPFPPMRCLRHRHF